jgi:hypothetical protein
MRAKAERYLRSARRRRAEEPDALRQRGWDRVIDHVQAARWALEQARRQPRHASILVPEADELLRMAGRLAKDLTRPPVPPTPAPILVVPPELVPRSEDTYG